MYKVTLQSNTNMHSTRYCVSSCTNAYNLHSMCSYIIMVHLMVALRYAFAFTIARCRTDFSYALQLIQSVTKACKEVFKPSFKRLLEYILAIGNFLNCGSAKGNCYGFNISSLAQVSMICFIARYGLPSLNDSDVQLHQFCPEQPQRTVLLYPSMDQIHCCQVFELAILSAWCLLQG